MSEELLQRNLLKSPEKIGKWDFYNIGSTTLKALKENNIIRNVDYGEFERKKVDALIVFRKNVVAVIEYKRPSEFNTKDKRNKAIQQEIEVSKKLGCKLIVATDTQETIWVNALTGKQIKDESGHLIKTNFDPSNETIAPLIEKINYSINGLNNSIKPKQLVNPTDLAKQIWQDIWSVSGATPENCLYTFVELFIFKYISDLGVLSQGFDFNHLLERLNYNDDNAAENALDYYAKTIRPKIKELFPQNTNDHTTIINGTIFVSKDQNAVKGYSTVFKKIILKFKDYGKLENIDYDFKSKLFESFLKESISKKNWGQFFTPLKVVRAIIEMANDDIKEGITICDPACGVGKFLLEPLVTRLSQFYSIAKNDGKDKGIKKSEYIIKPKITIRGFDKGFDKDEQKTIILAKANMLIYFSDLIKEYPSLTKEFSKLFNESFILKTNSILGTLSDAVTEEYDLIMTNPPYVTSGSSNLKEEIGRDPMGLKNHYKINAMGVEGLFMEWIIKALKPGGKAFVVIPDGLLNRQNDKNMRQYILDECFIDGLVSLPLNTFFTTNKKTYILCMTKKNYKEQLQSEPVFAYLVSEIGETRDVYRFDIDQHDLNEAVTLFSFFKGKKQKFADINTDKRCKIIPISYFENNTDKNWVIDKLWTKEEKIELGIAEKNESISIFDFSTILEDTVNTLNGLQEELKGFSEKKNDNLKKKVFKLNDIFEIKKGLAKYTKKYGDINKGEYPVFSASNIEPLTFINTFDYDGEFLTWATNGFAGYVKVISEKFSINGDRGLLKPKYNNISLQYVKHKIEPIMRELAKGRKGEKGEDEFTKVYPSMITDVEITMPIDENGNPDLVVQLELAEKYNFIDEAKTKINECKKQIELLNIEIKENNYNYQRVSIFDKRFFELNRGKRITKKIINSHKGTVPVYSSSKEENSVLGFISEEYLITNNLTLCTYPSILFNIDGSVGYCFIRTDDKYSFIDVVASLHPLTEKIDIQYLLYFLRDELLRTGADYQSKLYFNKIRDHNVLIDIPLDQDGDFDILKQKEIVKKYLIIEKIKKNIIEELDKINNLVIEYE
jgi:type I restriction-modification system DNA methylase subunit